MTLSGIERLSGTPITVRDFSTKALAILSGVPIVANQPVEIELEHGEQTFVIRGVPVRSDRVISRARAVWLTAVDVRWSSPQERSEFESLLWIVPRPTRRGQA